MAQRQKKGTFKGLPPGEKAFPNWNPYIIKEGKLLIISDIHAPFHEANALTTALEYGYKHGVEAILILGDLGDLFSAATWNKDPNKKDFTQEIITTREILEFIRRGFGNIPIYLKVGNHEERLKIYLSNKAQDLILTKREAVLTEFTYPGLIQAEKYDITVIDDRRLMKMGKLGLAHGHEMGKLYGNPVNPARSLFMKAKVHCLAGHWHQPSYHPEPDLWGNIIGCWSIGCLCDLHPDWLPVNKWQHGFAVVERLNLKGDFVVENKTIINGRVF